MYLLLFSIISILLHTTSNSQMGESQHLYLTIYPQKYAIVRDIRKINLLKGYSTHSYTDIPVQVNTESITLRLLQKIKGIFIQEQSININNDKKTMNDYMNKNVTMQTSTNEKDSTTTGILLQYGIFGFILKTQENNLKIYKDVKGVAINQGTDNDQSNALLSWKIFSPAQLDTDAQITYEIQGISYEIKYNMLLNNDETALNLQTQVSIINKSGKDYPNAKIKLLQSNANIQQDQISQSITTQEDNQNILFTRSKFSENIIYTTKQLLELPNSTRKTLYLMPTIQNIPLRTAYQISITAGQDNNTQAKIHKLKSFQNTNKNGLGISLPNGKLQLMKQDKENQHLEFINKQIKIKGIAINQQIIIDAGISPEVETRYQTTFKRVYGSGRYIADIKLIIANKKDSKAQMILIYNNPYLDNLAITETSEVLKKTENQSSSQKSIYKFSLQGRQVMELQWKQTYSP